MAVRDHKLPSLDGLRAVSIALVLFAHCADTPHAFSLKLLTYTGELGLLGVKVFFVVSGFLITSLLLKEHARTGSISLRNFYARRVLRIFPAFYVFLIILFILTRFGLYQIAIRDFVHAGTFTANLVGISWELLHIWSLSVEEQFYLLWPASLVLFGIRLPLRAAAALIVIPPIFFAFVLHGHVRLGGAISGLAAGCVLAGVRNVLQQRASYLNFLGRKWTPWLLTISFFLIESFHRFWFYELLAPVISICIALTLDSVLTFPSSAIGRFLNRKSVAYLGLLSYSIYLWQQIFLDRWMHHWFNIFPVNLVCVFACALGSFYLVERPFLKLKSRLPGPKLLPRPAPESRPQLA